MNPATIEALNRASSQELFHLSLVTERLMSDPKRVLAIRMRLHLGQTVRYVDCRQVGAGLSLRTGRVVAMKDAQVIVQDDQSRTEWKLPYAAIEMPEGDSASPITTANEAPPRPTRDDFRVGEKVSFEDRYLQTQVGTIVRINQRTASVDCNDQNWRVSFGFLRHIVDL
jgi:hypothetical protein